jgi:hypothetical protein
MKTQSSSDVITCIRVLPSHEDNLHQMLSRVSQMISKDNQNTADGWTEINIVGKNSK